VAAAREQRRIGGEVHDVTVALEAGQVGGLGDRGAQGVALALVVRGVFAGVDLRSLAVIFIVARKVVPKPFW